MTLTARQRDVLAFIAAGHSRKRCEEIIGIREGTFKTHLALAFARLGAHNDAHAVAIAMRKGLIE